MPLNLLKNYPDLLEIAHMTVHVRAASLKRIFGRDIETNTLLRFRTKNIRPTKKVEGVSAMETLFNHLTTEETYDEKGKRSGRIFEMDRSVRLHWCKPHIEETIQPQLIVFSYVDRIKDRGDVVRTYIYNEQNQYVVILEPQKSQTDYYLITAYYLTENKGGRRQIENKRKKRLPDIY